MNALNMKAAKEGNKEALWADEDKYPEILALILVRPDDYNDTHIDLVVVCTSCGIRISRRAPERFVKSVCLIDHY